MTTQAGSIETSAGRLSHAQQLGSLNERSSMSRQTFACSMCSTAVEISTVLDYVSGITATFNLVNDCRFTGRYSATSIFLTYV